MCDTDSLHHCIFTTQKYPTCKRPSSHPLIYVTKYLSASLRARCFLRPCAYSRASYSINDGRRRSGQSPRMRCSRRARGLWLHVLSLPCAHPHRGDRTHRPASPRPLSARRPEAPAPPRLCVRAWAPPAPAPSASLRPQGLFSSPRSQLGSAFSWKPPLISPCRVTKSQTARFPALAPRREDKR